MSTELFWILSGWVAAAMALAWYFYVDSLLKRLCQYTRDLEVLNRNANDKADAWQSRAMIAEQKLAEVRFSERQP